MDHFSGHLMTAATTWQGNNKRRFSPGRPPPLAICKAAPAAIRFAPDMAKSL
jgi:hypothetical protein